MARVDERRYSMPKTQRKDFRPVNRGHVTAKTRLSAAFVLGFGDSRWRRGSGQRLGGSQAEQMALRMRLGSRQ